LNDRITMTHGHGGAETAALIESIFMPHFQNPYGSTARDAALLPCYAPESAGVKPADAANPAMAFTTDSFVVKPLFFPGGDIGRLAVSGTVNDLLTAGAVPAFLSAAFILEEGLPVSDIQKIAASMAKTAAEAGVHIVTGDTKVVEGTGGLYINTAGVGYLSGPPVDFANAGPGCALLVTGALGSHHACILSQRMDIINDIESDAAPLTGIVSALRQAGVPLLGMRDVTRGGLATVLNEISTQYGLRAEIQEALLPVTPSVEGLCGILGLDPLYMGNEGNMLIAVDDAQADKALTIIRAQLYGTQAAQIGRLTEGKGVTLQTKIGGRRQLPPLRGESLPRIC